MSTATNAGIMVGQVFGAGLLVVGPTALGFWYANRVNKAREFDGKVRWPIAVGFLFSFLFLISSLSNFAREAGAPVELVIEDQRGAPSPPFPKAAEFPAADLAAYNQVAVDAVKSQPGNQNIDYTGESVALEGDKSTVVRNTFFLNGDTVVRQYVAVQDGRLSVVGCYYPDDRKLEQADLERCRSSAQKTLGKFVEMDQANG